MPIKSDLYKILANPSGFLKILSFISYELFVIMLVTSELEGGQSPLSSDALTSEVSQHNIGSKTPT